MVIQKLLIFKKNVYFQRLVSVVWQKEYTETVDFQEKCIFSALSPRRVAERIYRSYRFSVKMYIFIAESAFEGLRIFIIVNGQRK